MRLNPHVTLLAYDSKNLLWNIEIRGCLVEMAKDGAVEHNDQLARLYLGKADAKFFGDAVDAELQARSPPLRVKIEPRQVSLDAIFR